MAHLGVKSPACLRQLQCEAWTEYEDVAPDTMPLTSDVGAVVPFVSYADGVVHAAVPASWTRMQIQVQGTDARRHLQALCDDGSFSFLFPGFLCDITLCHSAQAWHVFTGGVEAEAAEGLKVQTTASNVFVNIPSRMLPHTCEGGTLVLRSPGVSKLLSKKDLQLQLGLSGEATVCGPRRLRLPTMHVVRLWYTMLKTSQKTMASLEFTTSWNMGCALWVQLPRGCAWPARVSMDLLLKDDATMVLRAEQSALVSVPHQGGFVLHLGSAAAKAGGGASASECMLSAGTSDSRYRDWFVTRMAICNLRVILTRMHLDFGSSKAAAPVAIYSLQPNVLHVGAVGSLSGTAFSC